MNQIFTRIQSGWANNISRRKIKAENYRRAGDINCCNNKYNLGIRKSIGELYIDV